MCLAADAVSCPAGTASSTTGNPDASYCTPCAAGFYGANNGSTTCTPCAAGAHASQGEVGVRLEVGGQGAESGSV